LVRYFEIDKLNNTVCLHPVVFEVKLYYESGGRLTQHISTLFHHQVIVYKENAAADSFVRKFVRFQRINEQLNLVKIFN